MNQQTIFQNMTKHTAYIKIELDAFNESDAWDGIGSVLNDAQEEGKISDWSYVSQAMYPGDHAGCDYPNCKDTGDCACFPLTTQSGPGGAARELIDEMRKQILLLTDALEKYKRPH